MTLGNLRGSVLLGTAYSLFLDVEAYALGTASAEAGVHTILLKGPSVARWLYGDGTHRPYRDIDILVAEDQVLGLETLLGKRGFVAPPPETPLDRPWHARRWTRSCDGVTVEVHRTLFGVRVPPDEAWSFLSERTEPMMMAGGLVSVLRPDVRALHLALHAAQHGAEPQPQEDLRRALRQLDQTVWEEAAAAATDLDALDAFESGLRLLSEGAAVATLLRLNRRRSVETVLLAQNASNLALFVDWFIRLPGARAKTRLAVRKLFPSASFMRASSPLARHRSFGLGLAYARRVAWAASHLPFAVYTWVCARREARAGD